MTNERLVAPWVEYGTEHWLNNIKSSINFHSNPEFPLNFFISHVHALVLCTPALLEHHLAQECVMNHVNIQLSPWSGPSGLASWQWSPEARGCGVQCRGRTWSSRRGRGWWRWRGWARWLAWPQCRWRCRWGAAWRYTPGQACPPHPMHQEA